MKTISPELDAHLAQEVTTLARCWRIVRVDGTEFFFTTHDVDLSVDGNTYKSLTGFSATAIANNSDLSVDNLDVQGVFDDESITIEDLRAGLFDYADVYIFCVNWSDLTQGACKMRRGKLGEVTSSPKQEWFKAELRGLNQLLQQKVGDLYGPECRVDLGSTQCGVDLAPLTSTAHVVSVTDASNFVIALDTSAGDVTDDTWFQFGVLVWTSGNNSGRSSEIKAWDHTANTIQMYLGQGYIPQPGDTMSLTPGCDKSLTTCKVRFANLLNMRAESYLPGNDQVFFYPNSQG